VCVCVCVRRTCLEDLVADGEARPVRLVVRDELDEQLAAAGDDRRRGDLPAELPQHGRQLVAAVVHLHEVVPGGGGGGGGGGSEWCQDTEVFDTMSLGEHELVIIGLLWNQIRCLKEPISKVL